MSQLHLFCELSDKIGFKVKHAIVLIITLDDLRYRKFGLLRIHMPEKSEEFFEKKRGHVVALHLQGFQE